MSWPEILDMLALSFWVFVASVVVVGWGGMLWVMWATMKNISDYKVDEE